EVKNVVKFLKDSYKDEIIDEIDITADAKEAGSDAIFDSLGEEIPDDDLYEEAKEIVMKAQKASTSYLQRKLRIGYARAARLIDMLEERGVVGSGSGAKPRDVIGNEGFGAENAENEAEIEDNKAPI
ncbi:MAG: DNA translocase FtsK, partial [bacterium]|nr:DNA translocase FtsK [bacterium]